jgi:hypothetical protein
MSEPVEILSERLHQLLEGKTVKLARLKERELFIEFSDGEHLFVDGKQDGLIEVSVG